MKLRSTLILLLISCLLALPALCESATATDPRPEQELARDITDSCLYNGYEIKKLHDGAYKTFWEAVPKNGERSLTVLAPAGETIGGILVRWRIPPVALSLQKPVPGGWETFASFDGLFYAQYYPMDGLREVKLVPRDKPNTDMAICEVTVLTPGRLPDDIQLWRKPAAKVDMMLIHGHPDDELLWFGGLIPYYGAELKKELLVVCSTPAGFHRRLELLDALWACGIDIYPEMGGFSDIITSDMNEVLDFWGRDQINAYVTHLYRRYKPDVVVTQDVSGEYGHGVHRAISSVARKAVDWAADPTMYPELTSAVGVWNVPKLYVHLYPENQIRMNWQIPLESHGGKLAQDVSREAFLFHKSQQERGWAVLDGGEHDNSVFGLYRSTVGPDVIGGDMFENIE